MASSMMTLNTGTKSSYNTTSYRPPSKKNSNDTQNRENPFMRNRSMAAQSQVKTQSPPPQVNAQNFPTLNNSRTSRKPTSSGPKTSLSSGSGYSAATRKQLPCANNTQPVRRHNPDHLVLSKTNLKANEGPINEFVKELGRSLDYIRRQQQDDIYFHERTRNIVEEMRYSLSPDEFDDWYEHHIEENGGDYYSYNNNEAEYDDDDDDDYY
jgi:hypothetical protein